MSKKAEIKLNKKHNGKEFYSKFQFVGKVKPVQKKDPDSDNWYDVEIADTTKTQKGDPRKVLQFIVETATQNNLKVEVAGMEMKLAYLYSQTHKKSAPISFADRFDKKKYPDETYHLIDTDWDKVDKFGAIVKPDMWVDVQGHYEFSTFQNDSGEDINMVKRIIDSVRPLKNGVVEISGVNQGDTFKVYDAKEDGNYLGMGKGSEEGIATIYVGWLNDSGKIYISKVNADKSETPRTEQEYGSGTTENGKFKIINGVEECKVQVEKEDGSGRHFIDYVKDFKNPDFKEINTFEMQIGIKSTYQNEETKNTKVNAVFLDYGKEKSKIHDVELDVFYNKVESGTDTATAFGRLEEKDFVVVQGIDNNRAEFTLVEVQEKEDDNPFADIADKVVQYERASTGTKKGLEIIRPVMGTFARNLLTEEEVYGNASVSNSDDPFGGAIEISDDDLPF